jgi:hypothetical protein
MGCAGDGAKEDFAEVGASAGALARDGAVLELLFFLIVRNGRVA